jgi:hypothetical protein
MIKTISSQKIIEQYIETCEILKETTLSGNYKTGNKDGNNIIKIIKVLENDIELANSTLPQLFSSENVVAKSKAAAHCISLNIRVNEAEKALHEVAKDETNGVFAFNAQMTLKVWHEQGYLKVYAKQIPRYTKKSK